MKKNQLYPLILASACMCSAPTFASEWEYQLEPYLLITSIDGDAGVGRLSGVNVDVAFDNILENLSLGGMLHFEAFNTNGWGFIADYGFMDLESDISGPINGVIQANVRQAIMELDLAYRHITRSGTLDYFVGIRWWDNDLDVKVNNTLLPGSISAKKDIDWIDPIIGARWSGSINSNWNYYVKGDIGGFGIGADSTASLMAGAKYRINDQWSLDIAYKSTWVDYQEGQQNNPNYFAYDTVTKGTLIGFIYQF